MAIKNAVSKVAVSDADKKIQILQKLHATALQRGAELLRENTALLKKLEKARTERNYLRKYYKNSEKAHKVPGDREKARVEYSKIE